MNGDENEQIRNIGDASDTRYYIANDTSRMDKFLAKRRKWLIVVLAVLISVILIWIVCVFFSFATFWRGKDLDVIYGGISEFRHVSSSGLHSFILIFYVLPFILAAFIIIRNSLWIEKSFSLHKHFCVIPLVMAAICLITSVLILFSVLPMYVEIEGYGECCYYIDAIFSPIVIYSLILLLISTIMTVVLAILNLKAKLAKSRRP